MTGETLVHLDNRAVANELRLVGRAKPLSDGANVALTMLMKSYACSDSITTTF